MGELMIKKYNRIKDIIFPNKKLNIFIISILFLGIITGAIFANIINLNDKTLVIDKIKLFIENINTNKIDSIIALKNSLTINTIYITLIWILGMTFIGFIITIILLFTKSFILGFSLASFILTYNYKGIILSTIYLIFGQLLNIFTIIILSIYSIMFEIKLFKIIIKKDNNQNTLKQFKNYTIIFIITIIISIISSLSESFLLPSLIKLIIKLFTK
mgnify:FL=1